MSGFEWLEDIIKKEIPDAHVEVTDLTGTRDHLGILVASDVFKGKILIDQHQILMNILKEELKSRIHAVKLQTLTKEKFAQTKG
jgi:stress-induced morphogen